MVGPEIRSEARPRRALLALGANLPYAGLAGPALLNAALEAIERRGLGVTARSRFWLTAPWPKGSSQPAYVNAVAVLRADSASLQQLWAVFQQVEIGFGRTRGPANAPRTMDLDLIGLENTVCDDPPLIVPHPRAHERAFVMLPLAEVAPDWVHPRLGRNAATIAAAFALGPEAHPLS